MRKQIAFFDLVGVFLSLFLSGCREEGGEAGKTLAEEALPVVVEEAGTGAFERSLEVQGTLEAVESAVVSARIPGPLLRVSVDLGDDVKAGETALFEVDPETASNQAAIAREAAATARAQVAVAEANAKKAAAVAEKSARDAERFSRLHGEGSATDNEWEQAETRRAVAEADVAVAEASLRLARQQVSQTEAQLAIAERQLSDATVFAPFDGVVSARLAEPGEMVAPGTPVVKLTGTGELKALAFLPARHYEEVVSGETAVEVRAGGSEAEPATAVVAAKSPDINPKLRVFEVKALVPGGGGAAPGAMADFRVVFERREGLSVPQEAVLNRAAGTVVFVARPDGTAAERPVAVGLRDGGRAEILSGLAPGDPVVVQGQTQLYDGRKIVIESLENPAGH